MKQSLKFSNLNQGFYAALSQRVNHYFKSNNISRYANKEMVIKTFVMLSMFFIPYFISVSGLVTQYPLYLLLCVFMGIGTAGIGLSIMHDANHGAYSPRPWVNRLLGLTLNLIGGNAFNWKVQHNVLHHTYTNVFDVDEDISPRGTLRMAPASPWKPFHKYQHAYGWLLYGLMTLIWVSGKDFLRLVKYQKDGMISGLHTSALSEWITLVVSKVCYYGYMIAIPILVLPFAWWQIVIGFLLLHYIAGFILAIVFQPAHVIDGTAYPMPDEDGQLENNWAIHQMNTTTDYAHGNRLLSWYVGGLNYQVEHHLFPNICHVHYRNLSPIVRETAKEFGIPYKVKDTFTGAIAAHAKQLKLLGNKEFGNVTVPA